MTRRYPAYRRSDLEWISEIPSGWSERSIRSLADAGKTSFIDGDWIETPYITDEGVRLIQTGNVGVGFYKEQGFRYISDATFTELSCTEVSPGDVLICRLAEPVGRACLAPDLGVRAITSVDVCILKTSAEVNAAFVVYLLSSPDYLGFMEGQCRGGTRDRVSRSFLGAVRVPIPPLPEQTAIAAFLDRETAKIDALVAEQRRLIDLLKEKRQAVISHAVTRGLNPDAKLKPSDVDWLGDVPEGWEVMPLKRFISMQSGDAITSERIEVEGAFPVYGGNGLRGFTDTYTHEGEYLLIGRQGALCGNVNRASGRFWASEHAVVVTPKREIDIEWLHAALLAMNLNQYSTSAAQPGLSVEVISQLYVALPPLAEQIAIGRYLDSALDKFDSLSVTADAAIALLQERRAALISAAVTGKIDVRDLVPQETEAA